MWGRFLPVCLLRYTPSVENLELAFSDRRSHRAAEIPFVRLVWLARRNMAGQPLILWCAREKLVDKTQSSTIPFLYKIISLLFPCKTGFVQVVSKLSCDTCILGPELGMILETGQIHPFVSVVSH